MNKLRPASESSPARGLAARAKDLFVESPDLDRRNVWAGAYLIFLAFFFFQAVATPEGFFPYRRSVYFNYYARSGYTFFLFFGLVLPFLPRRAQSVMLYLVLAATVIFYGMFVSNHESFANGNDRSEALSATVWNLSHGRFPYLRAPGYTGGPITPLTTAILLAFPGELLFHRPELMTLPVLFIGWLALAWQRRRAGSRIPLELLSAAFVLNPITLWELIWGSDLLWGGALLLVTLLALDAGKVRVSAVLFALTLCSRTIFFFLLPLWGIYVWRRHRAEFPRAIAIVVGMCVVFEVPLMLWDPHTFFNDAPLGISSNKLGGALPAHESLLANLATRLLPAGPMRITLVSGFLLAVSAILGVIVRDLADIALAAALLLNASLFFMGMSFLLDYLSWSLFPLFLALLSMRRDTG